MSVVCIPNVSEGQDQRRLQRFVEAAASSLLDLHSDADHHRSVLTLGGESLFKDLCNLAEVIARELDITNHKGAHPRLGALDVVPFVPLTPNDVIDAQHLATEFLRFLDQELSIPTFRYDEGINLPEVRRRAFKDLLPTAGPSVPHPRLGATALACRAPLVAYNVIVDVATLTELGTLVRSIRSPIVRTLGFEVAKGYQLSTNLVSPTTFGPYELYQSLIERGIRAISCELVGLVPSQVLATIPPHLYQILNLTAWSTFEARLALLPPRDKPNDERD